MGSGITRLIAGNNASETYVFTLNDANDNGTLDRRDTFTLEVFEGANADIETAENLGRTDEDGNAVEIRKAHSGGGQHYVNTSGGELMDVRDIIGGFFNASDADDLFNAIVNGKVSGVQDIEVHTDIDGNVSLKFDMLTNKARDGNNLETADIDTIIINYGNDPEILSALDLDAIPSVRPALTGTINNTNIDGADFTVLAGEDGDLTVSVEANGITVSEEVGDSILFGNTNDVGDATVTALRNQNADAPGVPDDFGFGGFISANDIEDLLDGFDSKTYEGTDGDNGDAFDFTLTFASESDETLNTSLAGIINGTNEDGAEFTLAADDGDVVLSVATEGVTATENFGKQLLFGNANDVGATSTVAALSDKELAAPGVPEDFDVGGFISANEIEQLLDLNEVDTLSLEGTDGDGGDVSFDFTLTFTDGDVF